jgi:hypothetical protein
MTALRLSRLQKRLLHGFDAESQRTNGGIARSPQELGLLRHPDTGNSSRSRRPLDRGGAPWGGRRGESGDCHPHSRRSQGRLSMYLRGEEEIKTIQNKR